MEWDEGERAKVIGLLDFESQTCPGCGGWLPETTDPDQRYVADLPHRCYRCDAVQKRQGEYKDQANRGALQVWPAKKKVSASSKR